MNVDFIEVAQCIGELMAAATHDLKTVNPADVGLDGVSVRAWRQAYAEGCKDMANKAVSKIHGEDYGAIKEAVMASFKAEFARLEALALPSQNGKTP